MDQATFLRKMSGVERLEQGLSLSDLVRELAMNNIVKQQGRQKLSKEKLVNKLRARLVSV